MEYPNRDYKLRKYSCGPLGLRLFTNERDLQIYIYNPLFTNQVQKMFYIDIQANDKNEPSLKASFVFI